MSRGGYRDGAGRPPGTPNRVTREIRELLGPLDEVAVIGLKFSLILMIRLSH